MNPPPDSTPLGWPPELLEHAGWLRRIARALVRDDAAADDLVQDALGAAAAARAPIRDPRAFLAGTVRRLAARARRVDVRRERRERERALDLDDALPATDELAARVDALRVVLEELRELPPAQQRSLTLRYLEGLEPDEIARREGSRPATVRAHVARGLAELRGRLDRRLGGRDAWCAVLAPFAGLAPAPPVTPAAPAAAPPPATVAPAPVLLGTGVLLVTAKAALVLVPALALGLWLLWDDPSPEAATGALVADAEPPTELEPPVGLAAPPVDPGAARATAPAPAPAPAEAPAAIATETVAALAPVRGHVVDVLTGEAVPFMALTVDPVAPVAADDEGARLLAGTDDAGVVVTTDERALSVPELGDAGVVVTTDEQGDLGGEEELPAGEVLVVEADDHGGWRSARRSTRVTFPFEEDLRVQVGPTFRLLTELPEGLSIDHIRATFLERPQRREVTPEAQLRPGELPWVRFPFDVTRLDGEGPWTLRLVDSSGLWAAEADVTRKAGVERDPVVLDFVALGAIDFVATHEKGGASQLLRVHVESLETDDTRRVFLGVGEPGETRRIYHDGDDDPSSVASGRATHLAPGRYRWTFGVGASTRTGEVRVEAGELARVEFDTSTVGPTFDAEVTLDLSADPERHMSSTMVMVMSAEDPSNGFVTAATRRDDDPPGRWRVVLDDLPDGSWHVVLGALHEATWEPGSVVVTPGGGSPTMRLVPLGPEVRVSVRAVDAASGEPLAGLEVAHTLDGFTYGYLSPTAEGQVLPASLPNTRASTLVVRAPGYRSRFVEHLPERDGRELVLELERGWSNVVRVFGSDDLRPVPNIGVLVEGVEVGRTDASGSVYLEGDAPPTRVALADDDGSVEVVVSGTEIPESGDPLVGWMFAVRTR